MNVAVYVRISTADQNASMQEDELRAYRKRRALTVVGEYQDTMSGAKDSRPALQRLLADARARKFDAVVVWKIDRFGRSLRHLVNTLADLEAPGVAFISLRDSLDFTAERKAPVSRSSGGRRVRAIANQRARTSGDESCDEAGQTVRSSANARGSGFSSRAAGFRSLLDEDNERSGSTANVVPEGSLRALKEGSSEAPCQIKGPNCTFPVGMNPLVEKIILFFAVVTIISLLVTACLVVFPAEALDSSWRWPVAVLLISCSISMVFGLIAFSEHRTRIKNLQEWADMLSFREAPWETLTKEAKMSAMLKVVRSMVESNYRTPFSPPESADSVEDKR